MVFWITIIALTLGAIIIAFMPAFRLSVIAEGEGSSEDFEHDVAVYRDQLAELALEKERGSMPSSEAEQARAEIARRLLAAQTKSNSEELIGRAKNADKFSKFSMGAIALVFVPCLSLLFYSGIGSPGIEAQPLAARLEAQRQTLLAQSTEDTALRELVKKAETHLAENPEDGRGWDVLAPIYFRLGDAQKSQIAYQTALRILGDSPARLSGLGEVTVMVGQGQVSPQAQSLFDRALAIDPIDGRSLYYSAIGFAQKGEVEAAFAGLQAIALNESIESEWRVAAADGIQQMGQRNSAQQPDTSMPTPDQETIDKVSQMPAQDQSEFVASMVERLQTRLYSQGGTLEEWQRLIRVTMVQNDQAAASEALSRAVAAFADKPDEAKQVQSFAESLGLNTQRPATQ